MLILHISIALASLIFATITFFAPSLKKITISYGLIIATVGTGTALLIINPKNLLHTCLSGLFYVTVVSLVTIATHVRARRLAMAQVSSSRRSRAYRINRQ